MDLSIKITADLQNAKSNLELLKEELRDLKQSLSNNDKAISGLNKQLAGLNTNTKEGAKSAAALKTQLAQLGSVNNTLVQGIAKVKTEIATEAAHIKTLAVDLKKAETATGGFTQGIGKAYSGLSRLAQLIPGMGIGGLIALIAGPLVDAFGELFTSSSKAGESLAATFAEASGSVGGNISRLQALVSIAQDITRSDESRKEALGALNKEYDSFNGKLTLSNINTKYATDLIDKQTNALIRQAKAKGLQDLITEETKKAAEVSNRNLRDQLGVLDKFKNFLVTNIGGAALGQGDAIIKGLKARDKALDESKGNVLVYSDALKKILGEDADDGTLFQEPKPAKAKKIKDKIIKALRFKPDDLEKMFFDESTISLKVPAFAELDFKKGLVDNPFSSENLKGILGPEALEEVTMKMKLAGMGISNGIQIGINKGVEELKFPELRALTKSAEEQIADMTEALKGLLLDFVDTVGADLGKAIANGSGILSSVLGSVLNVLGEFIIKLGKAAVTTSALYVAIKASSKNPISGFVAGALAIVVGNILKNIKLPAFADGVTNFGGGLAVVGERGPELVRLPKGSDVIPNHQLGGIGAAGAQVFIPDIKLRGSDMVVVFNRATQTIGRNT